MTWLTLEEIRKLRRRWYSIRARCKYPSVKCYKHYGGRGIAVCDEWGDFKTFFAWVIESGYRPDLEIDRVNTDGNYEPSNCRWVTHKENTRNTRSNVKYENKTVGELHENHGATVLPSTIGWRLKRGATIAEAVAGPRAFSTRLFTAFGESKTLSAWAEDARCVVSRSCLANRLYAAFMSVEDSLTTPSGARKGPRSVKKISAFGETKTVVEWSKDSRCEVREHNLRWRLNHGFSAEDAITTKHYDSIRGPGK